MLNKVVDLKVSGPSAFDVVFSDGARGHFDATDMLAAASGPVVDPLKEPAYFARVFLEFGAPTWPNGFDMCPDWLRMEIEKRGRLSKPVAAE